MSGSQTTKKTNAQINTKKQTKCRDNEINKCPGPKQQDNTCTDK